MLPKKKRLQESLTSQLKKSFTKTLDGLVDFPTVGLLGATKVSILDLITAFEKKQ